MTALQKLSKEDLQKKLQELQGELQQLRFDVATMKETKVHKVAQLKKTIARINTLLNQQEKQA